MTLLCTIYLLFAFIVILNAADIYTTLRCLNTGAGKEGNPILKWLFDRVGVHVTLIGSKVFILSIYLIGLMFFAKDAPILCTIASAIVTGWYTWIVIHNNNILVKHETRKGMRL